MTASPAFIPSSKRRKGYPSETRVKRGARCVHGDKELLEKLGWKDPCPCGSGRRFQELLHALGMLLTGAGAGIMSANEDRAPLLAKGARNGAPCDPILFRAWECGVGWGVAAPYPNSRLIGTA